MLFPDVTSTECVAATDNAFSPQTADHSLLRRHCDCSEKFVNFFFFNCQFEILKISSIWTIRVQNISFTVKKLKYLLTLPLWCANEKSANKAAFLTLSNLSLYASYFIWNYNYSIEKGMFLQVANTPSSLICIKISQEIKYVWVQFFWRLNEFVW